MKEALFVALVLLLLSPSIVGMIYLHFRLIREEKCLAEMPKWCNAVLRHQEESRRQEEGARRREGKADANQA